jgi:hypothetical protein
LNLPIEMLSWLEPCAVCRTIAHLGVAIGQAPRAQQFSVVCQRCQYCAPPQEDLEAAGRRWNAVQGVREHQRQRAAQ